MGDINFLFNVKLYLMVTVLTIVLAVLVVFNVWLAIWTAKLERGRRRKYQERLEECDERIGEVVNELGKAKQYLREAHSANAALKRSFEETIAEHEKLLRDYRKLQDDMDALKGKKPKAPKPKAKK